MEFKLSKKARRTKRYEPFSMKNVRKLPIVGDVHKSRE